jgi:hypothetical protein
MLLDEKFDTTIKQPKFVTASLINDLVKRKNKYPGVIFRMGSNAIH